MQCTIRSAFHRGVSILVTLAWFGPGQKAEEGDAEAEGQSARFPGFRGSRVLYYVVINGIPSCEL